MDNKTGSNHGRKVVRKCKNSRETLGTSMDRKRSENGHFSQRIVFTLHLGFADDFRRRSYPNAKKGTFLPEVLIQRS